MKHLKIFDEYIPTDYENDVTKLKELQSHTIRVFNGLGFSHNNYYDRGSHETEFTYVNNFYFQLRVDGISDDNLDLIIKKTKSHHSQITEFVPDYFKSISGIEFVNYDGNYDYKYNVTISSIPSIIDQISVKDFNLKLTANKYNL